MVKKGIKMVKPKAVKPEAVTKIDFKDFRDYLNVFEFDIVLPGSGEKLKIKPLTIGGIKQILTYDIDTLTPSMLTEMFDKIIMQSVITKEFDPLKLYLQDRYFLVLEIRKKTKGESIEYNMTCPECKSQSPQKIDFEAMVSKPMPENIDYNVEIIPDMITVRLKHLIRQEEKEIYDLWETFKKEKVYSNEKEADADLSFLLEAQSIDAIITPQGEQENVTILDKKYLLENIPETLWKEVSNWKEKNNFGPELNIKVKCPHCDFTASQSIEDTDFFS